MSTPTPEEVQTESNFETRSATVSGTPTPEEQEALTAEIREAYVTPAGLFGRYGERTRALAFDQWLANIARVSSPVQVTDAMIAVALEAGDKKMAQLTGVPPLEPDEIDREAMRAALSAALEGEQ